MSLTPLRLLIIEDAEDDALLLVLELRKGGYAPEFTRVETPEGLKSALDDGPWDAVISDYNLPSFTGLDALRIIGARGLDLPFILVSGVIGEEKAVEAMKAGAHDYIMKGNYSRLAPALEREVGDAAVRRERREAEEALRLAHAELERRVAERTAELQAANTTLRDSRRAALNMMEDAVAARRRAEEASAELRREIVERKRAEEALAESEERVRRKLDSILTPEGDSGNLELADIIDVQAVQALMDDFYRLAHIPMSIIDLKDRVLVGVGWQDICLKFHRAHPETCKNCIECDLQLTTGIPEGEFRLYKCKNNMWDVATPVMVGGRHLGNLFSGQFFFDDEPLDYELFRSQARQYGFDEREYLGCLEVVPRLSRESLATGMEYFIKFAGIISKLSYGNIKLARSLAERDTLMETLRRAKEEWECTFDNMSDLIAILDERHSITRVNKAMAQRLGATAAECIGQACYRGVHGTDRPPEFCPHAMSMADGRQHTAEVHEERLGGYFLVTTTPLLDERGTPIGSVHVAHDITERKRAEEELRRAHDELELRVRERTVELAETVETLLGEIAERERIETSLLRLHRLYAVLGEIDQAIIRADGRDALFSNFCRIAVEQGGFLLSWVGLLDEESGQVRRVAACGATSYLDDIRISAGEEPAGNGPTGTAIREGSYCICNDFLSDPCTQPWHESGQTHGIKASASVALKEEGRVIGALTLYAGEKDFFDQQHVELLVQMGADVSFALDNLAREAQRQKAEQELREETLERLRVVEALREKEQLLLQQSRLAAMGEMINNIAHQWRQPLNVLGLLVQQMRLFYDMGSFSREYLDTSVTKSMGLINHMSQTIDDFRNFFKPGKEKVEFTIHEVVARTLSLVEDGFKNQQIRVDFQADANPAIIGFPNEYSQALLNILMNARDALLDRCPDDAKVTVTIGKKGERAVVTIADNAGGIPEEIMCKIFEPYFTTKGPDRGTGVGLFMSKTIIEKNMNGRLTARNTAEGAEFRIEV